MLDVKMKCKWKNYAGKKLRNKRTATVTVAVGDMWVMALIANIKQTIIPCPSSWICGPRLSNSFRSEALPFDDNDDAVARSVYVLDHSPLGPPISTSGGIS